MSRPRILVVGAGPAGLMAAAEAADLGCAVTLVDEGERPGGQIHRQPPAPLPPAAPELASERARKAHVLARFAAVADAVDYRPRTAVTAFYGLDRILLAGPSASELAAADAVVLATGVHEFVVPFDGWTLPGVVTAGAVQAQLKGGAVRVGDRIAFVGAGPLPLVAAAQALAAGAAVPAVVLLTPWWRLAADPGALWAGRTVVGEGLRHLARLLRAGVRIHTGHVPVRAVGADGVEGLVIARHGGDGRPLPGTEIRIDADTVAVSFGFTANSDLARMAGAQTRFDARRGGWLPVRDGRGATSVPGLFVAGDGSGLAGALAAAADGVVVGAAAAGWALHRDAGRFAGRAAAATAVRARHWRFQEALAGLFDLPPAVWGWAGPRTTLCRCEGVDRARVQRALDDGHAGVNAIKRNSRAGMGMCGGRSCLRTLAALGGAADPAPMTARPGIRPVPLAVLANRVANRVDEGGGA